MKLIVKQKIHINFLSYYSSYYIQKNILLLQEHTKVRFFLDLDKRSKRKRIVPWAMLGYLFYLKSTLAVDISFGS